MGCAIDGCTSPVHTRGWCAMHYTRWKRHGDPLATNRDRRPAAEKLWERVEKTATCWLWTGYRSRAGYGSIADQGTVRLVHRLSWELEHGAIPAGLELDHLCGVRNCVNPEHLEPVTPQENKRRMLVGVVAARTHCPNGHPYAGDNVVREADGHRRCRICRESQAAARNERRRSA